MNTASAADPAPAATATRADALARAAAAFDGGDFVRTLARRVAIRTESQNPERAPELRAYLEDELSAALTPLGFACEVMENPVAPRHPFLVATRREGGGGPRVQPRILMYGHADVVRGQEAAWTHGAGPWTLAADGDRLYGRGTADNKGQHTINLAALEAVLAARGGRLGFDLTWLFETGEETGSPGLAAFCAAHADRLAADALIASDGPRLHPADPTVFLGSRGVANVDLSIRLRDGAHHSGNWGGLLANPGIVLAHAIASLVDARGRITVEALRPPPIPANVRAALRGLEPGGSPGDPAVDPGWGEPGLTPAERVFGWNSLEVLAMKTGNPEHPVNAIPDHAKATLGLRFVVGTEVGDLRGALRRHLDAQGFQAVEVGEPVVMAATRLDPDNPWVQTTLASLEQTTGRRPVLLPNLGGSLPNDVFADTLGLPTVWVPHSHPACSQHAPNEHLLAPVAREALQIMAGLFWDLGEPARAAALPRRAR